MYGAGGFTGNNVDATRRPVGWRTRSSGGAEIVYYTVISLTLRPDRPTDRQTSRPDAADAAADSKMLAAELLMQFIF